MGPVDSVWLTMDRPDNLMVIDSIMMLEGPVDHDRLDAIVQSRLVDRYPVFSQLAVVPESPIAMSHWEDDPDFDLRRHVHAATLPAPGDDLTLQAFIEKQMRSPLRRDRPLWEIHVIDGYHDGSVVVARFHHALADGMALAQVLLSMTDDSPDGDLLDEPRLAEPPVATRTPGGLLGVAARLTRPAEAAVRGAVDLMGDIPALLRPRYAVEALTLALQTGQIADKLLLSSVPESPLAGRPGVEKRAVWSRPRPLGDIKRVGRLAGATVNDVLVGAVSGAIAGYVDERGGDPADLTTMVPVNLRAGAPLPRELGNKFALVMLPLPTGRMAPLQRLAEAKRRMDSIKHSPEATLTFGIINAIGRANPDVAKMVVDFFAAKAIGVTTNVAGPMRGRWIAGTRISGVLGWVPGSGSQTLGVCIFSYDDIVRVGFKADATIVTKPEWLVHAFDDELDTLVRLASAV